MTGNSGAPASETLRDALAIALAGALHSPEGVTEPVALLWTDADSQWRTLIPALRSILPQLFVLGPYVPAERQGPVIWLKCIVDRSLPEAAPLPGVTPILYLPNVGRQHLRAAGDCVQSLQPLVELQYRGAVWHQRNGRDWSVEAFLTSDLGLGLDIAGDMRTREAMLRALPLLAVEPLTTLRGRRLEADDFDRLAIGDPIRDLLSWMSEPETFERRCDTLRWEAFRGLCFRQYGFDPVADGVQSAGNLLIHETSGGAWSQVWRRFCEAPKLYPGLSRLLRMPVKDLFANPKRRPAFNEEQEDRLRRELEGILTIPHGQACDRVIALDAQHRDRRDWVWAQLDESPYAMALEPLARLAERARTPLGGPDVQAVAADYAGEGWRCDRAAVEALGRLRPGKESALVAQVVRALYEPWLDRSARHFQDLLNASATDPAKLVTSVDAERDTCILFADGLRFDIAGQLQERLEARGLLVRLGHRFAGIPTVTATAKPLASPAHDACEGGPNAADFAPILSRTGQPLNASRLRDEMARRGMDVLEGYETRLSVGSNAGGWAEIGKLDALGHSLGVLLVRQIEAELDEIAERIAGLLNAGWLRVRVVTDHGWLLLPGGLPKVDLPPSLVATKWARCAAVRGESTPMVPTYPWYWNGLARIACPPGIGAFMAGTEYAHGGISPQECVIPDMVVERGADAVTARITGVAWRGMRCRVTVESTAPGTRVDLRLNWRQPASTIVAAVKDVGANGEASLAIADDRHEGAAATVVVLDGAGQVLDYKPTTVGEE